MSGRHPEERIAVPMVHQRWRDVSFLHWRYDPDALQARLPDGLRVDTFDGDGWVTLTPFVVEGFRPPLLPALPVLSTFPETNVRTYVVGPDGRDGLWFLTLEVDSVPTTIAARSALGVPYRWAEMQVDDDGDRVTYRSRRRSGGQVGHRIVIERGEPCPPDPLTDWLTGRWRAWTRIGGRFATVAVQHEPWPLFHAAALTLEETLLADVGLPRPSEPPLVHTSPGVTTRLGWPNPRRAGRAGTVG
ncbi:MAG TPA: DUF2071 domain-containing protein [Acidimicrobiales bacterium]|nr:DUF2071 domain-containing protein [Acidimicrobiales bacterium]